MLMTLAALVTTAALVALSFTASASGNTTRPSHTKILHFVATLNKHKVLRQEAIGGHDVARFRLAVSGQHQSIGYVYEEGTSVWNAQVMTTWGIVFNDSESSQITSVGLFSEADDVHIIPVTGGSGAYRGVTGEASWRFFGYANEKAHVTITLVSAAS
jgi:hypothetical protein